MATIMEYGFMCKLRSRYVADADVNRCIMLKSLGGCASIVVHTDIRHGFVNNLQRCYCLSLHTWRLVSTMSASWFVVYTPKSKFPSMQVHLVVMNVCYRDSFAEEVARA